MNFDISAASLRLNIGYVDNLRGYRTSTNKTSDIQGEATLAARGIIWTNLVEAHKMQLQTCIKALGLVVSDPWAFLN